MKAILYATDFSYSSIGPLNFAYALKEKLNTCLLISHVGDITQFVKNPYVNNEGNYKTMDQEYYSYSMYKIMEFVNNNLEGPGTIRNTYCKIKNDISPYMGLNALAREYETDLIVTGLNGANKGKIKDYYIGNNLKELILQSPSPVMAVPSDFNQFSSIYNIYYLSNFDFQELEVLQNLIRWATAFNAHVTILHITQFFDPLISDKKNFFNLKLRSLLADTYWSMKVVIGNTFIEGFNYITYNEKVDLLSFYENFSNNWIDKLYHTNLIKKNTDHSKIPLLAFNKKNVKQVVKNVPNVASHESYLKKNQL